MSSEPATRANTLKTLWLLICRAWLVVALGALIMPLVVWVMIMAKNIDVFDDSIHHYLGNTAYRYGGSPLAGYVDHSTIPKHLGGVIFVSAFCVAMMVFIILALAADIYHFTNIKFGLWVLDIFHSTGLYNEAKVGEIEYFFVVANAFLKMFIVAATGSQSFIGLSSIGAPDVDTPLFALYATMILFGSIPLTVIAAMFIIQRRKIEESKAKK